MNVSIQVGSLGHLVVVLNMCLVVASNLVGVDARALLHNEQRLLLIILRAVVKVLFIILHTFENRLVHLLPFMRLVAHGLLASILLRLEQLHKRIVRHVLLFIVFFSALLEVIVDFLVLAIEGLILYWRTLCVWIEVLHIWEAHVASHHDVLLRHPPRRDLLLVRLFVLHRHVGGPELVVVVSGLVHLLGVLCSILSGKGLHLHLNLLILSRVLFIRAIIVLKSHLVHICLGDHVQLVASRHVHLRLVNGVVFEFTPDVVVCYHEVGSIVDVLAEFSICPVVLIRCLAQRCHHRSTVVLVRLVLVTKPS